MSTSPLRCLNPGPRQKRFIATQAEGESKAPVVVAVQNWFEEFREPR